ncbi:MAG: hypothetical protein A2849_03000 [Candidatus Taylorbacteria bacterium RIFCSPHIGHO2_01_FULL_51_15]|uniref:Ada DNA repair metal-binding domain-containing protein n=1 Tax=Candidatus Taylorbacteria bacterium RIFCSPHIGHO2_01_FULL_51_15 TaxID=1802304 RepID=A0A1G2MB60_9BACT|nr:MAG: hypothetical protein A2849_03000 [Candidatus Taylorbacteria bacterium RIFCSPHIGHO2_01_FULL_51_15]
MNIRQAREKIKASRGLLDSRELYTVLLIILVGLGSFGLGRLSRMEELTSPIQLEEVALPQTASALGMSLSPQGAATREETSAEDPPTPPLGAAGLLVASKGGTKYHYPWCSGAQRISEQNKIFFLSTEDARKAGYTPAANCKGLK